MSKYGYTIYGRSDYGESAMGGVVTAAATLTGRAKSTVVGRGDIIAGLLDTIIPQITVTQYGELLYGLNLYGETLTSTAAALGRATVTHVVQGDILTTATSDARIVVVHPLRGAISAAATLSGLLLGIPRLVVPRVASRNNPIPRRAD